MAIRVKGTNDQPEYLYEVLLTQHNNYICVEVLRSGGNTYPLTQVVAHLRETDSGGLKIVPIYNAFTDKEECDEE